MPLDEWHLGEYGYRFVEGRINPADGLVTRWEKTESGIRRLDRMIPKSKWILVNEVSVPSVNVGVNSSREYIHNIATKEVLAERKTFAAWRGWIDRWIGSLIDNSVGGCNGGSDILLESAVKILIPNKAKPSRAGQ